MIFLAVNKFARSSPVARYLLTTSNSVSSLFWMMISSFKKIRLEGGYVANQYQRIKEVIAPTGDWFQILTEHLGDNKKRCIMSRVILWGLFYGEKIDDHVEGVNANGFTEDSDHFDYVYVNANDLAPDGRTWEQVFKDTPSFNWGTKDISEIAPKEFT